MRLTRALLVVLLLQACAVTSGSPEHSTYLGGGGFDNTCDLLVEPAGNVLVTGHTASRGYPTTGDAYSTGYGGGERDVFVSRLSPDLSHLSHSTLLGGSDSDIQPQLALGADGAVWLSCGTSSRDFPFTDGGYLGGESDYALCVFDPTLSTLVQSFPAGGDGDDSFGGICVDGEWVVASFKTRSTGLSAYGGGYDPDYNGGMDVYVVKYPVEGTPTETREAPEPTSQDETRGIPGYTAETIILGLAVIAIFLRRGER
ncbi:hypothetical protein JXL21_11295 [Candidatus Bathyarchaeota archaeon]|nr:hypothetical protein [Candidatus Bathyarchaeota archaeon]